MASARRLRARWLSVATTSRSPTAINRLLVVTGDLIEGTITPKLLERAAPGLTAGRRKNIGQLPTAEEVGQAIAAAATDATLPNGHTVVIGGALETLLSSQRAS